MKPRVATIILNRNLKQVTNRLYKKIKKFNSKYTDIFVVDAGSDSKKQSEYTTWKANWALAKKKGLRFGRGMNYALLNLLREGRLKEYDYFLLLTNDTIVENNSFIKKLIKIMDENSKIAILSPCSKKWGEKYLLKKKKLKFFWYIHNNAYFIRTNFISLVSEKKNPTLINFFFDGTNFRGYGADSELILKAYKNNMSAAITSHVWMDENEGYLLKKHSLIKTEPYNENLKLYVLEGLKWMRKKYKFKSRFEMNLYVKKYYDLFFSNNKNLVEYKI